MKPEINLELFASKIKEKRGELTYTKAANQVGKVTSGTLARCEQAKLPDLNTFIRICRWLDLPCDTFVVKKFRATAHRIESTQKYHAGIDPIPPESEATSKFVDNLRESVLSRFFSPHQQPEDTYGTMHDEDPFDKRHMPFADAKRGLEMVHLADQHNYDNNIGEGIDGDLKVNITEITENGCKAELIPADQPNSDLHNEVYSSITCQTEEEARVFMDKLNPQLYFIPAETDDCGTPAGRYQPWPKDEVNEPQYTMAITPEGEDEKIPLEVSQDDLDWLKEQNENEPRQCPVTNDQCAQGCLPGEPCCLKKPSGPDDSECTLPDLSDDELTKMNTP